MDLPWDKLSEVERVSLSKERLSEQFPENSGSSDKLEESLLNIIELCEENDITLIGIKFPLASEYSDLIGGKSYGADSILAVNKIIVYDFRDIFHNNDNFFEDSDHINSVGAQKLIDSIKEFLTLGKPFLPMKNHLLLSLMLICTWSAFAQTQVYKTGGYEFKESILLPATPVKNQAVTGTCWSYTTTSFLSPSFCGWERESMTFLKCTR